MAATLDDVVSKLNQILTALNALVAASQNAPLIQVQNVTVQQVKSKIGLPSIIVPDGFTLVIQSHYLNSGLITIASSTKEPNRVLTLLAGEKVTLRVSNTEDLQIMGDTKDDIVVLASERKG
jgi:hypothetical protein